MILTCDACKKRYLVETEDIGEQGRVVRCIACHHSWFQKPEGADEVLHHLPITDNIPVSVPKRRFFGWFVILSICTFMISALYMTRATIVVHWPAAERLYQQFGIAIELPGDGFAIEQLTPFQVNEEGETQIMLKGELVNKSDVVRSVPTLTIVARGACTDASPLTRFWTQALGVVGKLLGKETGSPLCVLASWPHQLTETRLFPGEHLSFETTPHAEIKGATDITIEF